MHEGLEVTPSPELARRSTIRLGGRAVAEVLIENQNALEFLPGLLKQLGGQPVVLGRGSNILAKDGCLPLVLLRLGENFEQRAGCGGAKMEKLDEDSSGATFRASAALPLPVLVKKTAEAGFSGFSGLAGIPGSVGGAVAMNAGAFDTDIRKSLRRVDIYSPARGFLSLPVEKLEMGYRHFAVPELGEARNAESGDWFIILSAEFYCLRGEREKLLRETEEFMARKQSTQPLRSLSAGCVFKNHAQGPAGRLLEEAGFKGRRKGGMMFSDLHANFLVNTGSGTSAEALELIAEAREQVRLRHGADLELEVRLWG